MRNLVNRKLNDNRHNKLIAWVSGCPHIEPDKAAGRESFTKSLSEVESKAFGFDPDFALCLGDFASNQGSTELSGADIAHGEECVSQLNSGVKITRNKIYTARGNHDAGVSNYDWYDRYIDLLGENTLYSGVDNSLRPYPISGTPERYSFQTGNVLWLVMSDKNDSCAPCGFSSNPTGGFPSGSVTEETYQWWEDMVLNNQDKIIISCHHNLLKDTTIATGDFEGVTGGYHGGSTGQQIGNGRLHNIITGVSTYEEDQTRFQSFLNNNPGLVSVWFGAHTHYNRGETFNGRSWTYENWGTRFVSVGGLTRFHGTPKHPQSVSVKFENGSNIMTITKFNHSGYFAIGEDKENVIQVTLPRSFKKLD